MGDSPAVTHTATTITFTYTVEDTEPIKLPYATSRYLPTTAVVQVNDGKATRIVLSGPHARKDGSAGERFYEKDYGLSWEQNKLPAWALDLADKAERQYATKEF
jgi:hypothetical protein